jgi:single-stranded DNA-binding protein
MKSSKFLPGNQLSGNIIDNADFKEFAVRDGSEPAVSFTMVLKDVWKDKNGEKKESEPYYAKCKAFGKDRVDAIKMIKENKLKCVMQFRASLDKWDDKETGAKKSQTIYTATFIEGWNYEIGEWHTVDLKDTADAPW